MKFGKIQEKKFGTDAGAYSIVTDRENYDSQITLTDFEAELVINYFGKENIHIGNVQSNKELSSKEFYLYPDAEKINLNIVYPKPEKTELRLYISTRAGFKPAGGEIWFIFSKDNLLWIGSMSERQWRSESSEFKQDEFDDIYQQSVNESDEIQITKLKERDQFTRNRNIALERLELSKYTCEYDASHGLFISRFSRKPYLEAHHLIPISMQKEFSKKLDTVQNVFCLCPRCHRAVHHAEEPMAREILSRLTDVRPVLDEYSLNVSELMNIYAVEEIV